VTTPFQKAYFGGQSVQSVTKTGAYTCDSSAQGDYVVLCNFSAAHAVTLPPATSGRVIKVKDIAGNAATDNITITPASGTIDGASTYVLNLNHAGVELTCDGTNWWVTAEYNGTVI